MTTQYSQRTSMSASGVRGFQRLELVLDRSRFRGVGRHFHELLPERETSLDVLLDVELDAPEAEKTRGVRGILSQVLLERGDGGLEAPEVQVDEREMVSGVKIAGIDPNVRATLWVGLAWVAAAAILYAVRFRRRAG